MNWTDWLDCLLLTLCLLQCTVLQCDCLLFNFVKLGCPECSLQRDGGRRTLAENRFVLTCSTLPPPPPRRPLSFVWWSHHHVWVSFSATAAPAASTTAWHTFCVSLDWVIGSTLQRWWRNLFCLFHCVVSWMVAVLLQLSCSILRLWKCLFIFLPLSSSLFKCAPPPLYISCSSVCASLSLYCVLLCCKFLVFWPVSEAIGCVCVCAQDSIERTLAERCWMSRSFFC